MKKKDDDQLISLHISIPIYDNEKFKFLNIFVGYWLIFF